MDEKRNVRGLVIAITILVAIGLSIVLFRWDLLLIGEKNYRVCSGASDFYPCVPCSDGVDWTETASSIATSLAACLAPTPLEVRHARAYHLVHDRATIVLEHKQPVEYFDCIQHRIVLRRVDGLWTVDWAGIRYRCWPDWEWTTEACRFSLWE